MSPRRGSGRYHGAGPMWPLMRSLRSIQRLSTRQRRMAAAVVGFVFLALVVIANQPPAPTVVTHAQAKPVAAHPTPPARPAPTPLTAMKVLHEHIAFSDDTDGRGGVPKVEADAGILVDVDTRTILWQRNPHLAHAPASTTKILSTLVALENFSPDHLVSITPDALTQAGDETVMGLKAGQQLTVQELLEGMLLVSGNDAADAMAVDTAGMASFVNAMNQQVRALGLRDSHFTTPVGLDDPAQLASPYDLAAVATADVTHFPLFRQIVARTDLVLPASERHPEFDLSNLNRLLRIYPAATGIKPGWTGGAGPCLVAMAERDGHRLIAVLMGAPRLYGDARALLDWGFVQEGLPPSITPEPK